MLGEVNKAALAERKQALQGKFKHFVNFLLYLYEKIEGIFQKKVEPYRLIFGYLKKYTHLADSKTDLDVLIFGYGPGYTSSTQFDT